MSPSTIAAISTPQGRGGIGIIRLSGDNAFAIIRTISNIAFNLDELLALNKRKLVHGYIKDSQGQPIDEVLMGIMPSSRSYTGEQVVEINCHSGKAVLSKILERTVEAGACIAAPGEFTRRAVEKGRIDLVKAEAINDLINARSEKALAIAMQQLEGGLTKRYEELKDQLISLLGEMEAVVDFEVDNPHLTPDHWKNKLEQIISLLSTMLKSSKLKKYVDHGFWVTLAGPPNAGKSSLFNAILNIERSIVCDMPGTTRDHISETIEIEGVEVKITDTAGLRETEDTLETLSIKRSKDQMEAADFILYVIDQSQAIKQEDVETIKKLVQDRGVLVLNKGDLPKDPSLKILKQQSIESIEICSLKNEGIENLLDILANKIARYFPDNPNSIVSSMRQRALIEKASMYLQNAYKALENTMSLDMAIYEIEKSVEELKEILGQITSDDVYDVVFKKFCVGK